MVLSMTYISFHTSLKLHGRFDSNGIYETVHTSMEILSTSDIDLVGITLAYCKCFVSLNHLL
jgi:hypothetical protein